jgi:predicted acyltransferase
MNTNTRYLALDVMRGLTIVLMIIVNTPGSWSHIYPPLKHAAWHGCTPTDLVFPFFLLVVGVSMFFSFSKFNHQISGGAVAKVIRRSVLIFAVGLFLNSFPQWLTDYSHLRILGVLQRIAIAYGLAAIMVLSINRKWLPYIGGVILLVYWFILYYFGGTDPYALESNVTIPFDTAILGENHLYKGFGIPFDPEGLLSTLPAIVTVIIGYLTGSLIRSTQKVKVPVKLLLFGVAAVVVGWFWGYLFPINKPLWTSSYVIYTAGWALMLLSVLVWTIDVKGWSKWTSFFVVFGMNPLFIFALSGLWAKALSRLVKITMEDGNTVNGYTWLFQQVFVPIAGPLNGSLLFALAHIVFFWLIGWVLYRNKIFIKV